MAILNTPRGYPYPDYAQANNFPTQFGNFAVAVDTDVQAQATRMNNALTASPSVRVSATANQSITAATDTVITYATEEFDNAAMGNLGVNNDRITLPAGAGVYLIAAEVNFVANGNATTNGRRVRILAPLNVVIATNSRRGAQSQDTEVSVAMLYRTALGGDAVRVDVRHTSGAAVNISARSLSVTKVA